MIAFPLPQGISQVHYSDDTMLIGPGDQEVAVTLDFLVRHLHVRGWDKSDKNSGDFYLSEISRGPVVWDMLRYPFLMKDKCYIWPLL